MTAISFANALTSEFSPISRKATESTFRISMMTTNPGRFV